MRIRQKAAVIMAMLMLCGCGGTGSQAAETVREAESAQAAETTQTAETTQVPETAQATEATSIEETGTAAETAQEEETAFAEKEAGKMPVSFEIHFHLQEDKVLDENRELKQEYRDLFQTGEKKIKTYGLAYFETPEMAFLKEGWINRIRMQDGKAEKGFELTYKKRYPVPDDDIGAAMRHAEAEGFDLSGEAWEPQIEWNYSGMTLSLSTERTGDAEGCDGIEDLKPADAVEMLNQNMPQEEMNWESENRGIEQMEEAQMAGPVFFRRHTGKYLGKKVQIEIWTVPEPGSGEHYFITELSFKEDDFPAAAAAREEMKKGLEELGILTPDDSLKTSRILNGYFAKP